MNHLKAAAHELRCWECRVTWPSWAQRLLGMKRGHSPKLPKQHRALVERARQDERERVAAELREDADAHRRVVQRKPSEYDEARLARARTLDDAAARISGKRGGS